MECKQEGLSKVPPRRKNLWRHICLINIPFSNVLGSFAELAVLTLHASFICPQCWISQLDRTFVGFFFGELQKEKKKEKNLTCCCLFSYFNFTSPAIFFSLMNCGWKKKCKKLCRKVSKTFLGEKNRPGCVPLQS